VAGSGPFSEQPCRPQPPHNLGGRPAAKAEPACCLRPRDARVLMRAAQQRQSALSPHRAGELPRWSRHRYSLPSCRSLRPLADPAELDYARRTSLLEATVPKPLDEIDAVLLDMDGTLVGSDAAVERAWVAWATEYSVTMDALRPMLHGSPALTTVRAMLPRADDRAVARAAQRQLDLQYGDLGDVRRGAGARP